MRCCRCCAGDALAEGDAAAGDGILSVTGLQPCGSSRRHPSAASLALVEEEEDSAIAALWMSLSRSA